MLPPTRRGASPRKAASAGSTSRGAMPTASSRASAASALATLLQAGQREVGDRQQALVAAGDPAVDDAVVDGARRAIEAEADDGFAAASHRQAAVIVPVQHQHAAAFEDARLGRGGVGIEAA